MDGHNGEGGNGPEDIGDDLDAFDDEDLESVLRLIAERAGQVIMTQYAEVAGTGDRITAVGEL